MDVISFAGRAIDTLKAIDSKCTRLQPLACARNARCGHRSFSAKAILTMSLGTLLSSCGGGGGGGSGGPPVTYTVTASVTGLVGTGLLLQNNGAGNITPTGSGSVVIQSELANGTAYRVSVARQPTKPWQTCAVANGSGVISQANVTNIAIGCTTNSYHIGGSISGVAGAGMTLQLNGGPDLAISADGTFNFASPIVSGNSYTVSVSHEPVGPGQSCTVAGSSGLVAGTDVSSVLITCVVLPFSSAIISLDAVDMAWNASSSELYVSVRSYNGGGPAILVIDARTGQVLKSIATTSGAIPLDISDDNHYLYAGFADTGKIQRYSLPGLTPDIQFGIGVDSNGAPLLPVSIAAMPGQSHTIAVTREYTNTLPYTFGEAVFDDGAVRPNVQIPSPGLDFNGVYWSADGSQIYSEQYFNAFCVYADAVSASGLAPPTCVPGVFELQVFGTPYNSANYGYNPYHNLQMNNGRLYTSQGLVYEPATRRIIGRFHTSGESGAIDPAINKAFFAYGDTSTTPIAVESFNLQRLTPIATQSVPGTSGAVSKLLRWGPYGLAAIADSGYLLLVSGTFVSDIATSAISLSKVSMVTESGSIGSYTYKSMHMAAYDVAWDSSRNRLYASVDGSDPTYGNAVVAIDPSSGLITGAAEVGSDPTAMSVSNSYNKAYVAHAGSSKVERVDLTQMLADATVNLNTTAGAAGFAISVDALPGSDTTHVGAFIAGSCCGGGEYVADDNTIRPSIYADAVAVSRWGNATTVYGNSGAAGFLTYPVGSGGVSAPVVVAGYFGNGGARQVGLHNDSGVLYDDNGIAYNPVSATLVGTYSPNEGGSNSVVTPSSARNRLYYAYTDVGSVLSVAIFQLDTGTLLDRLKFPVAFGAPVSMTSMGSLGIAFTTADHRIILLGGPAL